ncbi:MAG TPA: ABC transporter ATP-binding protein [Symbiobacteriaceae bacterium]|nr:ABC transporter ATP-binding protein [Symbiobacteriaceae bacterium]
MAAIQFANVSFRWGAEPILADLTLTVEPGEFLAVVGPSGCGKSTLLQLLAGLVDPQAGRIRVGGRAVEGPGHVALMPQRDALLPWRTVRENGALLLELQGVPRREALWRVDQSLERLGLEGWGDAYPGALSGGMRQRVAFLRTILTGQSVLLLDEPFGALDALTRLQLQEWLVQLWEQERQTVLFITHDVEEALLLADRVLLMGARGTGRYRLQSVPLARPRGRATLADPAFGRLKAELLADLLQPEGAWRS